MARRMTLAASTELAVASLRAAGQRVTGPRTAVLACLLRAGKEHLSADEVIECVGTTDPHVHRATVYRTLESLTAAGLLDHVHLDRGLSAFHAVPDPTPAATHLHAQCRTCGAVVDLPPEVLGDTAKRVRRTSGFVLDAGHVALSGLCRSCIGVAGRS